MIYYQSVENGSINRDVYTIKVDGKIKSKDYHQKQEPIRPLLVQDFQYFVTRIQGATGIPTYTFVIQNWSCCKTIVSNEAVGQKLAKYDVTPKSFRINYRKRASIKPWMIKPKFRPNKNIPVFYVSVF